MTKTNEDGKRRTDVGIYAHIPFCLQKCGYCDFYSIAAGENQEMIKAFAEAMTAELRHRTENQGRIPADTVFLGGGTPSLLAPDEVQKILNCIFNTFDVKTGAEISMECNPATVTVDKLKAYRTMGVNRLSIGVQSFDDGILRNLGRIHCSRDGVEAVEMARKAGFDNINLDLMFAVPGLDMDTWKETVGTALSLEPEHLSFYSLEIEEDTPFGRLYAAGKLQETPAEQDREMYGYILDRLAKNGYNHYEISNGAKPGRQCRHNLRYWNFKPYMGFGPSAHSFRQGTRRANKGSLADYIRYADNNPQLIIEDEHLNTFEDNVSEYVFTTLRTSRGVVWNDFLREFGKDFWDVFKDRRREFEPFAEQGFVRCDSSRMVLTRRGIDISNRIMAIFV